MIWDDSKSLANILASVQAWENAPPAQAQELRICILRNFSVEPMLPLLKHCCHLSGLWPSITVGGYDNILQEVLSPESSVHEDTYDIIVLALHLEQLDPLSTTHGWDESAALAVITAALSELLEKTAATVVVNTLLAPLDSEDSLFSTTDPEHRISKVAAVNAVIRELAGHAAGRLIVVDSSRIVQAIGWNRAVDPRFGYLYRAPYRKDFLGRFASSIATVGRALKGRTRKCLVLDCDNTLWGGVVGEAGIDGISLDPHEYPGRCYYDFQRAVLNLVECGVVVALCSKNNEQDVLEVIDRHPHCLVRREHLAAWRIDWNDKPVNIRSLAQELNIGLDSMVFIDDSPVECGAVRDMLPDVAVLQASREPSDLPSLPYSGAFFESVVRSAEDTTRTRMYAAERQRNDARIGATGIDDYLASLQLIAMVDRASPQELGRVSQLLGKTNQFNLTTRRYTESEVRAFAKDPNRAVYVLSAKDKFGDMGLVGVLIAVRNAADCEVDSLLLSCRALGRKLEHAFVDACFAQIERSWGFDRWVAHYMPTAKNQQVADFWLKLGFEEIGTESGATRYAQPVKGRKPSSVPFIQVQGRQQ